MFLDRDRDDVATLTWETDFGAASGGERISSAIFEQIHALAVHSATHALDELAFDLVISQAVYLCTTASASLRDWVLGCNLATEVDVFLKGTTNGER